ncbi:unnamed protein product [Mesocestoides corti]|uniref:ORF2/2 n=1 Tax=Mesocestoides corti TaxID=53468 RepID=A0A0R3U4T5_MESCO|nr:unnamed protein product [Mesocestoides corti]
MWFKVSRRKKNGSRPASTPLKTTTKPKKPITRFHWPSLRRCSFRRKPRPLTPMKQSSPARKRGALPALPTTSIGRSLPYRPPSRIRCGTSVIPIMRASAFRLRQPVAIKRHATTSEHQLFKMRRLSGYGHCNPIYDDVCSDSYTETEEEAIYEEIIPFRKRVLDAPTSYLDLMNVSALVTDSPQKGIRLPSPTPSQDVYALHGGDCVSIASGVYDDVASSSCSDSDEDFDEDAGIYGWATGATAAQNIPWPTAAYGGVRNNGDHTALRWIHRESYVIQ